MTRQTSIETYHKINDKGLLSARRLQVYNVVYHHGPCTSAEAFQILNRNSPLKNLTQSRARFTELRDSGVFTELGTKICSVTGHKAIEWDVTSKLPITLKKPKKIKCKFCKGKGYHVDQQIKFF